MIMDSLVFCTQTYQTTFQFFILITHVRRKKHVHILKKHSFSQQNIEQFSSNLRNRNWSDLLSYNDPNFEYNVFSNSITELFDTCFPLRTVKGGYKTRKPWLSEGSKRSIRRKISSAIVNKNLKRLRMSYYTNSTEKS